MTSGHAPQRKIGLLSNPNSRRNRKHLGTIDAIVANQAAIDHRITRSEDDIGATLRAFAANGIDVLAVNGGDGTTARVFTELLEQQPFERQPQVILLPGGTTNMNAGDVGMRGHLLKAVKRVVAWSNRPQLAVQRLTRPVLRVCGGVHGQAAYGMFFGTGTIIRGIEYCKEHVHSRGIRDELAPGVVAIRTIWGLARGEPYFSDPSPMQIDFDERSDETLHPVVQLLVTSLDRLFLGTRPYWGRENAPLHCTWLEKPAHKVLRSFPAVLRGKPNRHVIPENGYHSHNAAHIRLHMDGLFTLDGEMYQASRDYSAVTLSNGGDIEFLRIAST